MSGARRDQRLYGERWERGGGLCDLRGQSRVSGGLLVSCTPIIFVLYIRPGGKMIRGAQGGPRVGFPPIGDTGPYILPDLTSFILGEGFIHGFTQHSPTILLKLTRFSLDLLRRR